MRITLLFFLISFTLFLSLMACQRTSQPTSQQNIQSHPVIIAALNGRYLYDLSSKRGSLGFVCTLNVESDRKHRDYSAEVTAWQVSIQQGGVTIAEATNDSPLAFRAPKEGVSILERSIEQPPWSPKITLREAWYVNGWVRFNGDPLDGKQPTEVVADVTLREAGGASYVLKQSGPISYK